MHGRSRARRGARLATAATAAVLSVAATSCAGAAGSDGGAPASPSPTGAPTAPALARASAVSALYTVPSPLVPGPAGSIIRATPFVATGLPAGATAYRLLYHSATSSGADVAVSGVVVVPGGAPPPGGFPIVSWAHGTTGLAASCAPSLGGTTEIPLLGAMVAAGWIVAATDYEGLGASVGLHPYLVGESEAQDVLDAARAARSLVGRAASNDVVVLGHSQGGQAALFAGQIAQSYAPELFVAGVGAVAPVTSVLEFAPLPHHPSDESIAYLMMAAYAWSRTYGTFPLDSVLSARAIGRDGVLTSGCAAGVEAAYDSGPADGWLVPGWQANPALLGADQVNRPGQAPTSAPMLVVQGTADSVVPASATSGFVASVLCAVEHDTVEYVPISGAGHTGVLSAGEPAVLRWVRARFGGKAPPTSCGHVAGAAR